MCEDKKTRTRKNKENFCPYCKNHPEEDHGGMVKKARHECDKKSDDHIKDCKLCAETKEHCEKNVKRMQKYRQNKPKNCGNSPTIDVNPVVTTAQESSSAPATPCMSTSNDILSNSDDTREEPTYQIDEPLQRCFPVANLLLVQHVDTGKLELLTVSDADHQFQKFKANEVDDNLYLNHSEDAEMAFEERTEGNIDSNSRIPVTILFPENLANISGSKFCQVNMLIELQKDSSPFCLKKDLKRIPEEVMEIDSVESSGSQLIKKEFQTDLKTNKSDQNLFPKKDNSIKLFIRKEGGPRQALTKHECQKYKKAIEDMMDQIPPSKKKIPHFFYSEWNGGYWAVKCRNAYTKKWLMKRIRLLDCPKNSCLKVFTNKHPPRFGAGVIFSRNDRNDSDATILARLQRSNHRLNTSLWKIKERSLIKKNEGPKLTFAIDLDSLEEIKRGKCNAFYRMGRIKFKFHDNIPLFNET